MDKNIVKKNIKNISKYKESSSELNTGKILFVVNTEFALLIAILHYLENLSPSGDAVFILLRFRKTRFNNINFDHLPGEHYLFHNNMTESVVFPDREFEQILNLDGVTQIVYQHSYDLLTQVVIQSYMKEKKIPLTLINDGSTKSLDMRFIDKLKFLTRLVFRKYFNGYQQLTFTNYGHDIHSFVDCFIADEDIGTKHFINVNDLLEKILKYKKEIGTVYNFKDLDNYVKKNIIFFTQPIDIEPFLTDHQKKLYKKTIFDLSALAKAKEIHVLLKIHPGENPDVYKNFTNDFVAIDTNRNVPAEIILKLIRGKAIVSMYSSLSLYKDKKNKHFWLYKLMNYDMNKDVEFVSIPDGFEIFQSEILQYIDGVK